MATTYRFSGIESPKYRCPSSIHSERFCRRNASAEPNNPTEIQRNLRSILQQNRQPEYSAPEKSWHRGISIPSNNPRECVAFPSEAHRFSHHHNNGSENISPKLTALSRLAHDSASRFEFRHHQPCARGF